MCLGLAVALGLGISACNNSDVGKACDADADCGEGLECDVHDGKGTCQEPHGHEAGEAGEDTAHGGTLEDTAHHETGTTTGPTTGEDTGHGGTMEDTEHHDTEDTEHEHDTEDTEHGGDTTG